MPPRHSRGRGSRRRSSDRGVHIDHLPDVAGASLRGLPQCEEEQHVGGTTEPASAQTLQEQDVSSLKELLDTTSLDESSISATSSSSPRLRALVNHDWGRTFYIRVDRGGSFHTYPDVGGPFQSLQEVVNAVHCHLYDSVLASMWRGQAEISPMERTVRSNLYWLDGTRRTRSNEVEKARYHTRQFVQALVDNYNDDHSLSGDLAYELKDVVHYQEIYEPDSCYPDRCYRHRCYYHFNFTANTKGAGDSDRGIDNLFFAEVTRTQRRGKHEEYVVSCFCMVKPIDNGHCYGCTNNGSVDMKHPNEANAFTAGHLDVHSPLFPSQCCTSRAMPDTEWREDEVQARARIMSMFKGSDNPGFVKNGLLIPKRRTKKGT